MMQHPDHDGGIYGVSCQRKAIEIRRHIGKAPIAQLLAGILELRLGIVHQYHLVIAVIQVGQAPKAGAYVHQAGAPGRQKAAQRHAFDGILVLAALTLPKVGAIGAGLVITDRGLLAGWRAQAKLLICFTSNIRCTASVELLYGCRVLWGRRVRHSSVPAPTCQSDMGQIFRPTGRV
jgi:hypothetical protein